MKRTVFLIFVMILKRSDGKTASGISQFWSDDIKVFDKIYGRTSDRELYGATLPPTISFDIDSKIPIQIEASEKKERYLTSEKNILEHEYYPQEFGDKYAKLFSKSLYPGKTKPSSALQFISFSELKPISENSDPETYNYLKHLEKMTEKKKELSKQYKASLVSDSEEDQAYKSIQDILDAHEANKKNASKDEEEEYTRPKSKPKFKEESLRYSRNRNRSKVRSINGNSIKSRCVSGRCRSSQGSIRTRPYLRIIKHY